MDQSLIGQWLCWSRLRKGLTLHERLSVRMEIKRLLIRWGVMIIKYIIINLMIGTMADYLLFVPIKMWVRQYFGLNDDAGDYGDAADPNGGVGGEGGGHVGDVEG